LLLREKAGDKLKSVFPRFARALKSGEPSFHGLLRKPVSPDYRELGEGDLLEENRGALKDEGYNGVAEPNLLDLKIEILKRWYSSCSLCPRSCMINRLEGRHGYCGVDAGSYVHSAFVSNYEPSFLSPAGVVYFGGCNLGCVFCQNYELIENPMGGKNFPVEGLAKLILGLQERGAGCIEWLGGEPLLYSLQILEALRCAGGRVKIPQVVATNLYFNPLLLEVLAGVFDLWLCDFKFWDEDCAEGLGGAGREYRFLIEMNLGVLSRLGEDFIVVHLILPEHTKCCSIPVVRFSCKAGYPLLILTQYRPEYKARRIRSLSRSLTKGEVEEVLSHIKEGFYILE